MEILRTLITLSVMGAFFAILWWAYAPSRKAEWARKGVLDDEPQQTGTDHVFDSLGDGKRGPSLFLESKA